MTDATKVRGAASWLPLTCLTISLLLPLLAAQVASATASAVIFPPWWGAERAIRAAATAGDVAAVGIVPFVVLLKHQSKGALSVPGALLVLPAPLTGGCFQPPI